MNEELILKVLNVPVLVGWLSMVLAPRSRFTRWLVESDVLPLGIGSPRFQENLHVLDR